MEGPAHSANAGTPAAFGRTVLEIGRVPTHHPRISRGQPGNSAIINGQLSDSYS